MNQPSRPPVCSPDQPAIYPGSDEPLKQKKHYVNIIEPHHEKQTLWFLTWSDTNQAVQLQKMARGLKFLNLKVEKLYYLWSKKKALISFAVTAKLISVFAFAYAKCLFSYDEAQFSIALYEHLCSLCLSIVDNDNGRRRLIA